MGRDAPDRMQNHQAPAPRLFGGGVIGVERKAIGLTDQLDRAPHVAQPAPLAMNNAKVRSRASMASARSLSGRPSLLKPWPEAS